MKLLFILLFLMFQSCAEKPKIEITSTYISNGYWKNRFSTFFIIERMKVKKDSILNIFEPEFREIPNHWNIVSKLETDSLFTYTYTSGNKNKYIGDTIYFNKQNDGNWNSGNLISNTPLGKVVATIGNLEINSWYKFSDLRDRPIFIFVYIDSVGKAHRFNQDLSNY